LGEVALPPAPMKYFTSRLHFTKNVCKVHDFS
jgi:hypothetical protein